MSIVLKKHSPSFSKVLSLVAGGVLFTLVTSSVTEAGFLDYLNPFWWMSGEPTRVAEARRSVARTSIRDQQWNDPSFRMTPGAVLREYQNKTAQEKQAILFARVKATAYSAEALQTSPPGLWFYQKLSLFNTSYLRTTFNYPSDEMPSGGRSKLVHPVGTVAMAEFNAAPQTRYTGMFGEQGVPMIVRLSMAAQVDPTAPDYKPGAGFKFLVSGRPSQDIVTIFSFGGQGDNANFFANPLSTCPEAPEGLVLRAGACVFARALQGFPAANRPVSERILPVAGPATVCADGSEVQEGQSCAPTALFFKPAAAVAHVIASHDHLDFRAHLAKIPANTPLYEVYADAEFTDHLGTITTSSEFVASAYGDAVGGAGLFFEHPLLHGNPHSLD